MMTASTGTSSKPRRRPVSTAAIYSIKSMPGSHACKYRIAEIAALVIKKIVVFQIHEELRRRAVDIVGARHGERTALVLQAIVGLSSLIGAFVRFCVMSSVKPPP